MTSYYIIYGSTEPEGPTTSPQTPGLAVVGSATRLYIELLYGSSCAVSMRLKIRETESIIEDYTDLRSVVTKFDVINIVYSLFRVRDLV